MSAEAAARAAATTLGRPSPLALLSAEWRKVRGTWVLPLTVLGPLGVTLLGVILFLLRGDYIIGEMVENAQSPWFALMNQMGMVHIFALILGTALLASMIPDVDHRSRTWKQVLALPVTRPGVYLAKFALLAALLAVASVLCAAGIGGLWVWQGLGPALPLRDLAFAAALPLLGVLPLAAFQLLLSTALANQAIPLVIGVVATMFGLAGGHMSPAVPLALPIYGEMIAIGTEDGIGVLAGWSAGWAVVFLLAGAVLVSRRDVV